MSSVDTSWGTCFGAILRATLGAPVGPWGLWSIRVSENWHMVFRFEDNEAVDVDLVDFH